MKTALCVISAALFVQAPVDAQDQDIHYQNLHNINPQVVLDTSRTTVGQGFWDDEMYIYKYAPKEVSGNEPI